MSRRNSSASLKLERNSEIFAALGDPVRLSLVAKLIDGKPHSISALTEGTEITRQAVTKHLTVLENVGLVAKIKEGRECLYEFETAPLKSLQEYLNIIAQEWDHTLLNLKNYLESES